MDIRVEIGLLPGEENREFSDLSFSNPNDGPMYGCPEKFNAAYIDSLDAEAVDCA